MNHIKVMFSLLLERISKIYESIFYPVNGTTFGRILQLIKFTALYSIYDQNQLKSILAPNVASFDVINCPRLENYNNFLLVKCLVTPGNMV